MLEPNGVQVHWITDGKYDRTGIDPRNIIDEPQNRRGPRTLPLRPHAWNHLRLTLRDDTVDLELNDQLVYQRDIEPANQRTFGLFHFADETEVRVRNVIWRGDWPRIMPSEQQLAGDSTIALNQSVAKLKAVFEHDFAKDGLPKEYFQVVGRGVDDLIVPRPDGVHAIRPGVKKWSQTTFGPRFRVEGDFDITATIAQLKTQIPISGTVQLRAVLQEEANHHCRIARVHQANAREIILGHATEYLSEGRRTRGNHESTEADSGRMRLARRGEIVYFLFAEGDSQVFRLIASERSSTDLVKSTGITLTAVSVGSGTTSVVWKHLSIRAEKLTHVPGGANELVLYVMSADGKQVRRLTAPIGNLGSHGSPAWSPDGRQVAFDTYNGSTSTSHIYVISADGKELKDLGIGSMPTFSADGKRIAFSWSGRGITIMNSDGSNREVLDPSGWGAQWSPDGESIAYGARNITILDTQTKQRRTILEGPHASRYSYIYWNLSWSLVANAFATRDEREMTASTRSRSPTLLARQMDSKSCIRVSRNPPRTSHGIPVTNRFSVACPTRNTVVRGYLRWMSSSRDRPSCCRLNRSTNATSVQIGVATERTSSSAVSSFMSEIQSQRVSLSIPRGKTNEIVKTLNTVFIGLVLVAKLAVPQERCRLVDVSVLILD